MYSLAIIEQIYRRIHGMDQEVLDFWFLRKFLNILNVLYFVINMRIFYGYSWNVNMLIVLQLTCVYAIYNRNDLGEEI